MGELLSLAQADGEAYLWCLLPMVTMKAFAIEHCAAQQGAATDRSTGGRPYPTALTRGPLGGPFLGG